MNWLKGVKKGVMGCLWSNFPLLLLSPFLPFVLLKLPGLEVDAGVCELDERAEEGVKGAIGLVSFSSSPLFSPPCSPEIAWSLGGCWGVEGVKECG